MNLPAMQETLVLSLDQEDPLEEGMATYSNTLVWRIPGTEEPGRLHTAHGVIELDMTQQLNNNNNNNDVKCDFKCLSVVLVSLVGIDSHVM